MSAEWKKCENDAGFPYYVSGEPATKRWNHPLYFNILEKVKQLSAIKYSTYRMAHKIKTLQDSLKIPGVRLISGVFAHHCLSISESSFVLEPCELEAILTDIYFAAQKDGSFEGDVDLAAELALSFLLDVYDCERTSSVSIQSAKTALVILSDEPNHAKWRFLFSMMSDHNSCISPRRLTSLLNQVSLLAEYVGEKSNFGQQAVQSEVDKCFSKTPGMLGLSEHGLFQWIEGESPPLFLTWMDVLERLKSCNSKDDTPSADWKCSVCDTKNPLGLKFKCIKCWGMLICEKCYLYNDIKANFTNRLYKHKKSHVVKEIIDSQGMPSQYIVRIVKRMKRVLTCPSNCGRTHNLSADIKYPLEENNLKDQVDSHDENKIVLNKETKKHKVYTSTVGKAGGNNLTDPRTILEDIIIKLENQNRALKSISGLMDDTQNMNSMDRKIQHKVNSHFSQIATQINRLKMFQESLLPRCQNGDVIIEEPSPIEDGSLDKTINVKNLRIPAFEVFSPIPTISKDCINEITVMEQKIIKNDIAKYANVTKRSTKNPDSISNVSMSDISTWYGNESDKGNTGECSSQTEANLKSRKKTYHSAEATASEDKFNADIESVATSNNKMKELNADLDSVLDRLQTILTNNFTIDEINFDNTQLQETASEMEGLLGSLIRGVEQRRTIKGDKI